MRILIVTPARPKSRAGNRVTALRWRSILRDLGHQVTIDQQFGGQRCELLIALHARRSATSVAAFHHQHPEKPIILALTGTDLYSDIHHHEDARQSLQRADRFVVLQKLGVLELPEALRSRARAIYQSVNPPRGEYKPRKDCFEVAVVGHLREVKDPFRTAEATRLLPPTSRVAISHLGGALSPDMEQRARREEVENPRYHWLGDLPRWKTIRHIARARLLVLSSEMEGGAHVVCEALACRTPVISTDISGSIGLLGEDYPGYFPFRDTRKLADLLERVENDETFCGELVAHCRKRATLIEPARERDSWAELIGEIEEAP